MAETAGLGGLAPLEVDVSWTESVPLGWRLVVQEFAKGEYAAGRPVAAAQRVIGADAARGVRVRLHRRRDAISRGSYVVAWLEPGETDLEYDGLQARPSLAAWVSGATTRRAHATVRLGPGKRNPSTAAAA